MKVWLINHYAVPVKYYPLARTTNFAKYLIRKGHEVTIFAASSVHNSEINLIKNRILYREEWVNEIHYVLVHCKTYKGNGIDRIFNMFEFPWKLKKVCQCYERPDVIMASSATPPACMQGLKLAKKYGAGAIAEISDLWPESFVAYHLLNKCNPLLKLMYLYEKRMYIYADKLIFTMEGAYNYILKKGWNKKIDREKVFYINNGIDLEQFCYNRAHFQIQDNDLNNHKLFKVVYVGSIRKVNNLGLLLDAAKLVQNPEIQFLIWGDGDELAMLKKRIRTENINNVKFKGKVNKKYIPYITSSANLNFLHSTDSEIFQFGISANKIFDYLASGKPTLVDFDCPYNPIVQTGSGIALSSPNAEEIREAIIEFKNMEYHKYKIFCDNAAEAAKKFDFYNLTNQLEKILKESIR